MNRTDENTEKAFEADAAQLEPAIEPTAASYGTPPPATEAAANELTPGQHAFALRQAEAVIFGHDDQPVAAYQRFSDDIDRISLPDVSDMSIEERQAAAEACIAVIRHHFGLDQHN